MAGRAKDWTGAIIDCYFLAVRVAGVEKGLVGNQGRHTPQGSVQSGATIGLWAQSLWDWGRRRQPKNDMGQTAGVLSRGRAAGRQLGILHLGRLGALKVVV